MFKRFTDPARRVVVLAQEEARMLNHNYIGTEHILLGLIREGEGVAAQVLQQMGIDVGLAGREVIRLLSEHPAAAETAGAAQSVEAARCGSCQTWLSDSGRITALEVQDEEGRPTTGRLLYCSSCGVPLGTVA
jgi:ATP-dependent Clp protease ATP-binding subunit ClpC